jgi:hypothetical protein
MDESAGLSSERGVAASLVRLSSLSLRFPLFISFFTSHCIYPVFIYCYIKLTILSSFTFALSIVLLPLDSFLTRNSMTAPTTQMTTVPKRLAACTARIPLS